MGYAVNRPKAPMVFEASVTLGEGEQRAVDFGSNRRRPMQTVNLRYLRLRRSRRLPMSCRLMGTLPTGSGGTS
jgi:hypothetical protein